MHKVKDFSPKQKSVIESLLRRVLSPDESISILPSRVTKEAPIGDERKLAFEKYFTQLDEMAGIVETIPDEDTDSAIDQAWERCPKPQLNRLHMIVT